MTCSIKKIVDEMHAFQADDHGAMAIEYALIASGVALAISPVLLTLGNFFVDEYNLISSSIQSSTQD